MNQTEAESVKDLAKPVVEALKKVAERECVAWHPPDPSTASEPCALCNNTGKVGWKWQPKVGEWCLYGNTLLLITKVTVSVLEVSSGMVEVVKANKVIPILSWETIKRVLEKCNHRTYTSISDSGNALCQICFYGRRKGRHNVMAKANGKSRQQAVMLATIKLGEEKHD